ncbi:MAG TPA: ParA family protein [Ktedonobacteraceae bacterium]|nr:ParA family protein [Ktedonobacteraceae bacterium]
MLKVISIENFKGGTGKSSLCQNLAAYLAAKGVRVLIVDGDRQRNTTTTLLGGWYPSAGKEQPTLKEVIEGVAPLDQAIYQGRYQDLMYENPGNEDENVYEERIRENIFVIPSHPDLDKAAVYLSSHRHAFYTLRTGLKNAMEIQQARRMTSNGLVSVPLSSPFQVVLIDHAGSYSPVMEALLLASTGMFIPMELEPYCVAGIFDMEKKLKADLPDHQVLNYGIIPYAVHRGKAMTAQYLYELEEEFGDLVIQDICTDANIPKAQSYFETILEYKPKPTAKTFRSPSQADFETLATYVIETILEAA